MSHQLCLGANTIDDVIDRTVTTVCSVAPALPHAACRDLVDLIFRTRVRQTTACGHFSECQPTGSRWGDHEVPHGGVAPAGWHDADVEALPRMFASTAVGLMDLAVDDRTEIEARVASAFRRALGAHLFVNPDCGRAAVCKAPQTTPFRPLTRKPLP